MKMVPFVEKYCTAGQAADVNMGHAHSTQETNTRLHENRSSGSRVVPCGRTERRTNRQIDRQTDRQT